MKTIQNWNKKINTLSNIVYERLCLFVYVSVFLFTERYSFIALEMYIWNV